MKTVLNNGDWPKVKRLMEKLVKVYRKDIVHKLKMGPNASVTNKLNNWIDHGLVRRTGKRGMYAFQLTAKGKRTDEI